MLVTVSGNCDGGGSGYDKSTSDDYPFAEDCFDLAEQDSMLLACHTGLGDPPITYINSPTRWRE